MDWLTFKKIKGYNKTQLNRYLENLYKKAFTEGVRASEDAEIRMLEIVLDETKGIGPVLKDRILKKMKEGLESGD